MDRCLNVSDSSLSYIFSQCVNLEVLDIGRYEEVTDTDFEVLGIVKGVIHLKVSKARNCPNITIVGISMHDLSCKSRGYLDVRSCPHVTKVGCDEVGLQFPNCCKVNFA